MMMPGLTWFRKHHEIDPLVIDVETSVKNRGMASVGSMPAAPFHPDNKIVLLGQLALADMSCKTEPFPYNLSYAKDKLLIGHNIKFDLLYLIKESANKEEAIKWLANDVIIWDTMVVEYLLSGQQDKFKSLDELAIKYGGTIKDSKIKRYWDDGVDTEDIPLNELSEYLEKDLYNTGNVFSKQLQIANRMNLHDLIGLEMESLKDTVITEWYGMYINLEKLEKNAKEVLRNLNDIEDKLSKIDNRINWSSPKQVQAFLYGGKVKLGEIDVPTGEVYKTGKKAGLPKTKKAPHIKEFFGYLKIDAEEELPYSFSDEESLNGNLKYILSRRLLYSPNWNSQTTILVYILRYRALYKDFHTYYIGLGKLIWPNDSCVHATYNHTGTSTGRLSCHSPNLQNITSME